MPRRCLKVLLDHSLLQGSIRDGILMHDLLRAFAIARISPTHLEALNGELLGTHTGGYDYTIRINGYGSGNPILNVQCSAW